MATTTNEPQPAPSGNNDDPGDRLTATAHKLVLFGKTRGWRWTLSDGTRGPETLRTRKAALAAADACIAVRAMTAREYARRALLRAFVHSGCERVALDQLARGDRAWLVMAMKGPEGDKYPTRWQDVVIDGIEILIPGESVIVYYHDPQQRAQPIPNSVLCVFEHVTIGANRRCPQAATGQGS